MNFLFRKKQSNVVVIKVKSKLIIPLSFGVNKGYKMSCQQSRSQSSSIGSNRSGSAILMRSLCHRSEDQPREETGLDWFQQHQIGLWRSNQCHPPSWWVIQTFQSDSRSGQTHLSTLCPWWRAQSWTPRRNECQEPDRPTRIQSWTRFNHWEWSFYLKTADPVFGSNEALILILDGNQNLLDIRNTWHVWGRRWWTSSLMPDPGTQSLQGSITASPTYHHKQIGISFDHSSPASPNLDRRVHHRCSANIDSRHESVASFEALLEDLEALNEDLSIVSSSTGDVCQLFRHWKAAVRMRHATRL